MNTLDISLSPAGTLAGSMRLLTRRLYRHKVLFLSVAVLVTAAGAAVTLALPPKFTAITTVAVNPEIPDPLATARADTTMRDDDVATQAQLLTSLDLITLVVEKTGFGAAPPTSFLTRWPTLDAQVCGRRLSLPMLGWVCGPGQVPSLDARIRSFLASVHAAPIPRTRLIELSLTALDPTLAASALNELVRTYQEGQIARRVADLARTADWVSVRSEELRRSWLAAENRVGEFRAANGLVGANASEGGGQPLVVQQMMQSATRLGTAQDDLIASRSRAAQPGVDDRPAGIRVAEEPALLALGAQLATLRAKRASFQASLGDNNPTLLALDREIAAVARQLAIEQAAAEARLQADLRSQQTRVAEGQRTLDNLRSGANQLAAKSTTLTTLQNEAKSAAILFETFLSRARQLDDRATLVQSQVEIASHAVVPSRPSFPNVPRLLAASFLAGLFAGGLVVTLRESFATGVNDIDQIGRRIGIPLLCCIPMLSSHRRLFQYKASTESVALIEAMRTLLTQLVLSPSNGRGHGTRSVAIVSATGREGKTTTAMWLARTVSVTGRRVLLLDGDHRRGLVGRHLGNDEGPGLSDILLKRAAIHSCIKKGKQGGFDFVSAGKPTAHAFGAADVLHLRSIVAELEADYDLVIVDTPPLLAMSDALLYANAVSATVLLCRWRSTSVQALETCIALLRHSGAHVAGLALSMVDHRRLASYSQDYSAKDVRLINQYYLSH